MPKLSWTACRFSGAGRRRSNSHSTLGISEQVQIRICLERARLKPCLFKTAGSGRFLNRIAFPIEIGLISFSVFIERRKWERQSATGNEAVPAGDRSESSSCMPVSCILGAVE